MPRRLPAVLTVKEMASMFLFMSRVRAVLARLLYGTGMRITETLQLRIKDVDFDHHAIIIREEKGFKDRVVTLPESRIPLLKMQIFEARAGWAQDVATDKAEAFMPNALVQKYRAAGVSWVWVLPQAQHSTDPRSGVCEGGWTWCD